MVDYLRISFNFLSSHKCVFSFVVVHWTTYRAHCHRSMLLFTVLFLFWFTNIFLLIHLNGAGCDQNLNLNSGEPVPERFNAINEMCLTDFKSFSKDYHRFKLSRAKVEYFSKRTKNRLLSWQKFCLIKNWANTHVLSAHDKGAPMEIYRSDFHSFVLSNLKKYFDIFSYMNQIWVANETECVVLRQIMNAK